MVLTKFQYHLSGIFAVLMLLLAISSAMEGRWWIVLLDIILSFFNGQQVWRHHVALRALNLNKVENDDA